MARFKFTKKKILIGVFILIFLSALYYINYTPAPGISYNFPYGNKIGQFNVHHGIHIHLPIDDTESYYIHNFQISKTSGALNLTELGDNNRERPTPSSIDKNPEIAGTEDWKTCEENSFYRFRIHYSYKYPPDWIAESDCRVVYDPKEYDIADGSNSSHVHYGTKLYKHRIVLGTFMENYPAKESVDDAEKQTASYNSPDYDFYRYSFNKSDIQYEIYNPYGKNSQNNYFFVVSGKSDVSLHGSVTLKEAPSDSIEYKIIQSFYIY